MNPAAPHLLGVVLQKNNIVPNKHFYVFEFLVVGFWFLDLGQRNRPRHRQTNRETEKQRNREEKQESRQRNRGGGVSTVV